MKQNKVPQVAMGAWTYGLSNSFHSKKTSMADLNEQQKIALEYAQKGHNFILQGSAGTGKTFLIKSIYENLTKNKKSVAILCTTGISCQQYGPTFSVSTVHR